MFGLKKKQKQEPTLKELCDAVAEHPDSVIVAVFDRQDFDNESLDPSTIDHAYLGDAIYRLVMAEASGGPIID